MKFRQIFTTGFLATTAFAYCLASLPAVALFAATDGVDSFVPETHTTSKTSSDIKEESATQPSQYEDISEDAKDVKPSDIDNGSDENDNDDEGTNIADPLSPLNKVMFNMNDKLYFWLLKPAAKGYAYVLPEFVRVGFSNTYDNLKSPARVINNLLQLRLAAAGNEFIRFLINSTCGIGGLEDIAKDVLEIKKQEADFGQTLGHYGIGHGIYIVWPVLGPSSLRETVGFVGDRLMYPLTYISESDLPIEASIGIAAHEKVNDTSFRIGDYESFKKAVVDPYTAMRDSFVQYRKNKVEQSYIDKNKHDFK